MESAALVLRGRGIAPGRGPVLATRILAVLSLMLLVVAVRAQGADELLARVAQLRDAEGPSAGEVQFQAELDRARAELLPDVRLQQNSHWNFSSLPDLSLGVSATVPLEEPRLRARRDLALKGLELAQHNAAAERRRELYQLRRSLRMLAHLEELQALLEEHQAALLERSPELMSLEDVEPNGGRGDPEAVFEGGMGVGHGDEVTGYLEVDLALKRTRGERRLLSEAIERRPPSAGLTIPQAGTGRPTLPPLPELDQHSGYCRVETDETRRARLVHEEEGLAIQREAAGDDVRVTVDLNGDVRYSGASVGRPWQLGAGVGVNVTLPVGAGLNPSLSLDVSPSSLSQSSSLGWPGESGHADQLRQSERQDAYRESIREAELSARQAQLAFEDSRRRLRLRRIALASLVSEQEGAGQDGRAGRGMAGSDQEILQARADLLGAELEHDLAHMELARACGSDEQDGWRVRP